MTEKSHRPCIGIEFDGDLVDPDTAINELDLEDNDTLDAKLKEVSPDVFI